MRGKYLNVGNECVVRIPKEDAVNFGMLNKYDGEIMKVSRKKPLGSANTPYFELDGAVSDKGIPYAFIREWLIAL